MPESKRAIILSFGTTNLDKARKAMKTLYAEAKAAAKLVKDVDRRKELLRQAKESYLENRELLKEEGNVQRAEVQSRRQRRRARVGFAEAGAIDPGTLLGGSPDAIAQAFLSSAPGLGAALAPAAALFGIITPFVADFVNKRLDAFEAARTAPLLARLERMEAELLSIRLAEDVDFRANVLREDVRQARGRQGLLIRSADVSRLSE